MVNLKLSSERGIDYGRLLTLLTQHRWQDANRETLKLLILAAGQPSDVLLEGSMIPRLPCPDLNTIDQLWLIASEGDFGFSAQRQIWQSLGGKTDWDTYCALGDRLGWRKNGGWITYSQLIFAQSAPLGHLPFSHGWFFAVMNRLLDCNIEGGIDDN
ncbi:MAG: GUN4 domain-containing protein [Microcoleaceae cyanobacterium]